MVRPCWAAVAQLWGVGAWLYIFVDCILMELGRSLEPFRRQDLTTGQWLGFAAIGLGLLLVEGIRAFQMSFSPLLIRRAKELQGDSPVWELLLAPFFVAGLVSATPRRLCKSWLLVAVLIPGLALTVPMMPYPWRQATDFGVVLGLGWGTGSVLYFAGRGLAGQWPEVSPDLPAARIKPPVQEPLATA
ncbi:unnamed protein product [Durusdinium trenchii]|uniref:Uncharacterized protein n=2 Tax=Durusdinium trenchii TaxID=1381693 RepID=A0ABP0RH67_9DINO